MLLVQELHFEQQSVTRAMRNNIAQGARGRLKLPDCKSTLCHLTSYGIWANYLTSL